MLIEIERGHREFFLLQLVRAGCRLKNACRILGFTIHQGRYVLEKRGLSVRKLRRYYNVRYVTPKALDAAHRLLAAGATCEEIAMVTGLTAEQICFLDRFGTWVEGEQDIHLELIH